MEIEYRIVEVEAIDDWSLNEDYGKRGWQLCGVYRLLDPNAKSGVSRTLRLIFSRPVHPDKE